MGLFSLFKEYGHTWRIGTCQVENSSQSCNYWAEQVRSKWGHCVAIGHCFKEQLNCKHYKGFIVPHFMSFKSSTIISHECMANTGILIPAWKKNLHSDLPGKQRKFSIFHYAFSFPGMKGLNYLKCRFGGFFWCFFFFFSIITKYLCKPLHVS